jgi:3-hydroxyisobutyrate dehydrogenase-like beta-hydroxyacid dehydrogenase
LKRRGDNIIAILYPGELGARVGAGLVARGKVVITTLDGRGEATGRRCAESGIVVRPTISEVIREAQIVLSLVPPAAAADVARRFAALAQLAPLETVFVDLNSISPALAVELGGTIERSGRSFVDGAINGLASRLGDGGTLFLSGARASEVAAVFEGVTRVQVLGPEVGAASSMKMLLSGISKGVCALYAELALVAERQGVLDGMLDASSQIYPEVTNLVRRMLPTYALHSARRAEEMRQLERTVRDAGILPLVTGAVRQFHESLAQAGWPTGETNEVVSLLEGLAKNEFQSATLKDSPELAAVVSQKE